MADIVLNRVTHIEFPNNPEVDVRHISIESGSLLLEEILCAGNIVFGETNATRFEATVYNLPRDVSGYKIKVYQTDIDGNNPKDIFEGYVDSCKYDRKQADEQTVIVPRRKLVAYDALYSIGNVNVAGWWLQFWTNRETAILRELRESLCEWVGIPYDKYVTLPNDNFECTKTATLSSVSFNTMLFWICEIQCTIPHIGRDGMLRFVSLTNELATATHNITDNYERNSSEFEGFETAEIDAVELYDYDGNLVTTTDTTGAVKPKNIYTLKDNSLLFTLVGKATAALVFVQDYLARISTVRYTPCDVNMIVSDLSISVGDRMTVEHMSADGIRVVDVTSIVLQNTLSGSLLVEQEIVASGNEYLQDSSNTPTAEYLSLEAKTDKIKDDIITDDLLSYSHTNDTAYAIQNTATPIVNISIDMPNTSNLVFLATINLESVSTETIDVSETVTINGTECEITRKEKVPVVVEGYYEWNGATLLTNKPTETYSTDGKHLFNLMFFSIGGRQIGSTVKFRVFLSAKHGKILIGQNQVNATIISKGSSAGNLPWDGTITVEDSIASIPVGTFTTKVNNLRDMLNTDRRIPASSVNTDTIGLITPEFGTISVTDIDDTVEPSIT